MERTNMRKLKLGIVLGIGLVGIIAVVVILCVWLFSKGQGSHTALPSGTVSTTSSMSVTPTATVECWQANEITFTSTVEYNWP